MPHAQFVEDIGVGRGEIGDRKRAQQQALEHGLLDDPAGDFFIRADGLQPGRCNRRGDQLGVDRVEVHQRAGGGGFFAEGHQDKTQRQAHGVLSFRSRRRLSLPRSRNLRSKCFR